MPTAENLDDLVSYLLGDYEESSEGDGEQAGGFPDPGEDDGSDSESEGVGLPIDEGDDSDVEDGDDEGEALGVGMLESEFDTDENSDDESSGGTPSWEDDPVEVEDGWSDSIPQRDDRISEYSGDAPHTDVRTHLREAGVAGDVQDALQDIGTEERDEPSPRGSVLDMPNVIRRLAGDTMVDDYYRQRAEYSGDEVAVGVSMDASGSMLNYELEAKAAIGAFLFAVQENGGEVVANAWRTDGIEAQVHLLTNPYERFRWEHLDAVTPDGKDPIAKGMLECAAMLDRARARDRLLIVVSDGRPTVTSRNDGYSSAVTEARDTVEELRDLGLTVVGLGFGDVRQSNLETMFGADGYRHVELEDLADAFIEVYQEQVEAKQTDGLTA